MAIKQPPRQQDEGAVVVPPAICHPAAPVYPWGDHDDLKAALTGSPGSFTPANHQFCRSDWTSTRSGGADFTLVPAALHHPAALWEVGMQERALHQGLLVSALVVGNRLGGIIHEAGEVSRRMGKEYHTLQNRWGAGEGHQGQRNHKATVFTVKGILEWILFSMVAYHESWHLG